MTSNETMFPNGNNDEGDLNSSSPEDTMSIEGEGEGDTNEKVSMVQAVLNKCVPPTTDELKTSNGTTCSLCKTRYLTGDSPDVPTKLPCGHIVGTACLLKWLFPLSMTTPVNDFDNACPQCEAPVLDAHVCEQREKAVKRFEAFNKWQAKWVTNFLLDGEEVSSNVWPVTGERLFLDLCVKVVDMITDDDIKDPMSWLERRAPLIRILNFATLANFVEWLEDVLRGYGRHPDQWMFNILPAQEVNAIRLHLVSVDRTDRTFMDPDEATFSTLAEFHDDIRNYHSQFMFREGMSYESFM